MANTGLIVTPVDPDTLGQIIYEVKDSSGVGLLMWVRKEEGRLAMTSQGANAEVDYWQIVDAEEWDRELGGLATYAELYEEIYA